MFFQVPSDPAPIQPETLFNIGTWPVTNAMLMGVLVSMIVLFLSLIIRFRTTLLPSRFQAVIEIAVESFFSLTAQILGSKQAGHTLLPLIGTIFVFFGLSNVIGLIPGLTSLTLDGVPLLRTPTNDFNMTFSVAFAIIVLTHIMSIKTFGPIGHIGKYIKLKEVVLGFRKGIGAGVLAIVDFFLGLLDIIGEIAKMFSLSLRLFGNMYAGEIMAGVLLGAFAAVIPSVWLGFNLFVAILQAMVFGALTAAYWALAVHNPDPDTVD
jgi:F-type H+-transporting ATPase subunit a